MEDPDRPARADALNAILRVAVRHTNLLQPRAFQELVDTLARFVPFRAVALLVPEPDGANRLYGISRAPDLPFTSFGARIVGSPEFRAHVLIAGEIQVLDDLRGGSELDRAVAEAGFLSRISLPVRGRAPADAPAPIVAALVLGYGELGAASRAPLDLLAEVADTLGESLERSILLTRQRRLAMILETSGDAMLAWDREGRITDVNAAALRLTGRTREALLGMPIRELLGHAHPEGGRLTLAALGPDGAPAPLVVSATVTAVEDDPQVAAHALLRDLSQVVAAERDAAQRLSRIHELEEQHRTLLDNAPLIIFRIDPRTGELVYLNRHAERLLGVPRDEALRTPDFLRGVHADEAGARSFEAAIDLARRGAPSAPYEARLRRKEGEPLPLRGIVYPLLSERGEVVAIEGTLADVSAEHAQRKRLVQLDRLSTLGTLAAGLAHEINNPAAHILLGLGMLGRTLRGRDVRMEGATATTVTELLRELTESIQRITDITRDLKLFASSPAGDNDRRALIDVNRSVESALSLTRGRIIDRARLDLRLQEVPLVFMNEGRLGQVIVNLLVNAAQAIPKPSAGQGSRGAEEHVVTVETRGDGRTVEIEVRDTGAGITPEDLPRIWEPFFTTKSPEGTGLGLPISREIIERAGGRIRAESPVISHAGQPCGSRFVISLPVAERLEETTPVTSPTPRLVSRASVLIVEDEAPLGRALADQLGRVHDVTVAPSADAALGMLAAGQRFDAVLCDLRMPGMSGEAFYTHVAASDPDLARGFIFMTGVSFGEDVERFLAQSGRPLMEKPFSTEEALEAIAEVASLRRVVGKKG